MRASDAASAWHSTPRHSRGIDPQENRWQVDERNLFLGFTCLLLFSLSLIMLLHGRLHRRNLIFTLAGLMVTCKWFCDAVMCPFRFAWWLGRKPFCLARGGWRLGCAAFRRLPIVPAKWDFQVDPKKVRSAAALALVLHGPGGALLRSAPIGCSFSRALEHELIL